MTGLSRRALLAGVAGSAVISAAGCSAAPTDEPTDEPTPTPEPPPVVITRAPTESTSVAGGSAVLAAAMSGLLLERSQVAVLSSDDPAMLETAAALAQAGRWPVLVGTRASLPAETRAELDRLGVEHLVVVDSEDPEQDETTMTTQPGLEDFAVTVVPAAPSPTLPDGVPVGDATDGMPVFLVVDAEAAGAAAAATARAFGAVTHTDIGDPREMADVMSSLREQSDSPLVAMAAQAAGAETLLVQSTMAQRAPELPGGGVTVFPHRRMIALYGHPGVPVLGLLGEQGLEASIERVGEYVERYSPLVEEPVIPAFEIIASVATAGAGPDQQYSKIWPPEIFRAWVDAAKDAGVYVVLDLQPGRTDFLTQAKAYEELLIEPHVGLALDPEWRLGPNERHLVRIGSVEAAEINAVSEWLAELVRTHDLPQKVLTLHQFRLSMIKDRETVRTDHPEIAVVLHADGQGGQGAKQDTWRVLKEDLPEDMWLGWKNFYDEDTPMLTPEQTVAQVDPVPWFISYQ
ncbi:MAG: hypothetical protein ABR500_15225 [Dermatophilaceae bacterium]|nr:hypothetical protein [Intrasporangiaceae bacterium]